MFLNWKWVSRKTKKNTYFSPSSLEILPPSQSPFSVSAQQKLQSSHHTVPTCAEYWTGWMSQLMKMINNLWTGATARTLQLEGQRSALLSFFCKPVVPHLTSSSALVLGLIFTNLPHSVWMPHTSEVPYVWLWPKAEKPKWFLHSLIFDTAVDTVDFVPRLGKASSLKFSHLETKCFLLRLSTAPPPALFVLVVSLVCCIQNMCQLTICWMNLCHIAVCSLRCYQTSSPLSSLACMTFTEGAWWHHHWL